MIFGGGCYSNTFSFFFTTVSDSFCWKPLYKLGFIWFNEKAFGIDACGSSLVDIMRNSKQEKPSEPYESSPNALDQYNIHLYPDWATMQAYYGPRFAVPPYLNSAVASTHAPHPCMWGSQQSMIPPFGAPYAGFYAHGGIYAHPGVPSAGTALCMDTHVNSSGNIEGGFVRKLRELEGLAMSIGNGNGDRELSRRFVEIQGRGNFGLVIL